MSSRTIATLVALGGVRLASASCRSISVGPDYDILAAGDVMMTSPRVTFGNDVQIIGDLTVQIAVP